MRLVFGHDLKPFECARRVEINAELWNCITSGERQSETLESETLESKVFLWKQTEERCRLRTLVRTMSIVQNVVKRLSGEQTAIHRHAWDRRRRHDRACEAKRKSQLSIKQHNKNDERWMHDWPLDKDPRWLVLDLECRSRNKTPCAVRQISLGSESQETKTKNKNRHQWKM